MDTRLIKYQNASAAKFRMAMRRKVNMGKLNVLKFYMPKFNMHMSSVMPGFGSLWGGVCSYIADIYKQRAALLAPSMAAPTGPLPRVRAENEDELSVVGLRADEQSVNRSAPRSPSQHAEQNEFAGFVPSIPLQRKARPGVKRAPQQQASVYPKQAGAQVEAGLTRTGDFLPELSPLAMPAQDFTQHKAQNKSQKANPGLVWRVVAIALTALASGAFAYELYGVLSLVQVTPLQGLFWLCCILSFGWMAHGAAISLIGFIQLRRGKAIDSLNLSTLQRAISDAPLWSAKSQRTALLCPVYHEDPERICAALEALVEDFERLKLYQNQNNNNHALPFDVFVLSDSQRADKYNHEMQMFGALRNRLKGKINIYYRRREKNSAKKSGNIADWVRGYGGAYAHFLIYDADSIMSGETILRLAATMIAHPRAGLIQTVPQLVGARSLFSRMQAFASALYGPLQTAGLCAVQGHEGNYWGHNAIIRTRAFAMSAGLPELSGKPPFGGHIQSHDFVEAALLLRGGWQVHLAPSMDGSYEGCPPNLIELAVRDRRWCQGNLQHVRLLRVPGLKFSSRLHMGFGALAYCVTLIWAASLVTGLLLAYDAYRAELRYFGQFETLFPTWPVQDPDRAILLFGATLCVVMLAKILAVVHVLLSAKRIALWGGALPFIGNAVFEIVFSVLMAPVLMVTQSVALAEIFLGRDSGWGAQMRDDSEISFAQSLKYHRLHMAIGVGGAFLCGYISLSLLLWVSPALLGLICSPALTYFTARTLKNRSGRVSALLLTPQLRRLPRVAARTEQRLAEMMALQGRGQKADISTDGEKKRRGQMLGKDDDCGLGRDAGGGLVGA